LKKLKELLGKNRVVFVLVSILVICIVAIILVMFSFFFTGTKSSYGDRLDKIKDYPVTDEFQSSYISSLKESKIVSDAKIRISGRIIYITIDFNKDTSLDEAESVATSSVDKFAENILKYYDLNFILTSSSSDSSDGFTIMGARNANGHGVVWNNRTQTESE
jgi:hypothetical protein